MAQCRHARAKSQREDGSCVHASCLVQCMDVRYVSSNSATVLARTYGVEYNSHMCGNVCPGVLPFVFVLQFDAELRILGVAVFGLELGLDFTGVNTAE